MAPRRQHTDDGRTRQNALDRARFTHPINMYFPICEAWNSFAYFTSGYCLIAHCVVIHNTKTDCAYVKMAMAGCGAMDFERVGNITMVNHST